MGDHHSWEMFTLKVGYESLPPAEQLYFRTLWIDIEWRRLGRVVIAVMFAITCSATFDALIPETSTGTRCMMTWIVFAASCIIFWIGHHALLTCASASVDDDRAAAGSDLRLLEEGIPPLRSYEQRMRDDETVRERVSAADSNTG